MSPEGVKQAQTYIQNLVDSYGDLGVAIGDIRNAYLSTQDVSTMQKLNLATDNFDSKVEELRKRLAAEGRELDTHVLYTIVAQDQFSGKAKESRFVTIGLMSGGMGVASVRDGCHTTKRLPML